MSIVIPALDEERYIGGLLDSLERQTYPPADIEVLVADGGSGDATRAIVLDRSTATALRAVRLIDNPARTTPHGLNAGAAAAEGAVIIILGAHSEVADDFVAANVATLQRTGAAAAGGPIETLGHGDTGRAIAAALSHPFGVGDARFRYATDEGETDTIAFAAYRRECFDVLGGFDPARVNAEDGHFNYRIRAAGGRLYLDPAIRSRYYGVDGYRALARQYYRYGKGKGRAIVEEPGLARPRHLVPAAVVAGGACLALAGLRSKRARGLLMTLGGAYWSLANRSGKRAARRAGDESLAPLVARAFPVMHIAYGAGSLLGMARALLRLPAVR